jgi:hypothetical protein
MSISTGVSPLASRNWMRWDRLDDCVYDDGDISMQVSLQNKFASLWDLREMRLHSVLALDGLRKASSLPSNVTGVSVHESEFAAPPNLQTFVQFASQLHVAAHLVQVCFSCSIFRTL